MLRKLKLLTHKSFCTKFEHGELPTSMSQLTFWQPSLFKGQTACLSFRLAIRISDGEAMFQNKGFTLIEMLLVISIILTLSVLSFPFMNTKTIHITDECVKKQIGMIINQAKSKAIIYHEKVSLIVSEQEISFIDHQKKIQSSFT